MSAYVSVRQHTLRVLFNLNIGRARSAGASICQRTSAYVSVRQRTSAYVSIPEQQAREERGGEHGCGCIRCLVPVYTQHSSAYVSIREHASSYVSTRQHTSAYAGESTATGVYDACCVAPERGRWHTPAYASIRQHTPAYASKRCARTRASARNRALIKEP